MSVDEHTLIQAEEASAPDRRCEPGHRWPPRRGACGDAAQAAAAQAATVPDPVGFGLLAFVSAVFGMAMSVTHDLPKLENAAQLKLTCTTPTSTTITGVRSAILEPPTGKVIDTWQDISPAMVHAIVAVEDKRFWTDPGVDLRGLLRAFVSDATGGPKRGGFDDRRAVRQERARGGGQPHDLREAP